MQPVTLGTPHNVLPPGHVRRSGSHTILDHFLAMGQELNLLWWVCPTGPWVAAPPAEAAEWGSGSPRRAVELIPANQRVQLQPRYPQEQAELSPSPVTVLPLQLRTRRGHGKAGPAHGDLADPQASGQSYQQILFHPHLTQRLFQE